MMSSCDRIRLLRVTRLPAGCPKLALFSRRSRSCQSSSRNAHRSLFSSCRVTRRVEGLARYSRYAKTEGLARYSRYAKTEHSSSPPPRRLLRVTALRAGCDRIRFLRVTLNLERIA
jgi:hypothetical protein